MLKEISFYADDEKKRHPPQKKEIEPSRGTQMNKKTSYVHTRMCVTLKEITALRGSLWLMMMFDVVLKFVWTVSLS